MAEISSRPSQQARPHVEAASKKRERALVGELEGRLVELAQMWKERLQWVVSMLEAKLMRMATALARTRMWSDGHG